MNVVALTSGKPYHRYVLNELHARHPLCAVMVGGRSSDKPSSTSLRQRYWAASALAASVMAGDWERVRRHGMLRRLERAESRLMQRALRRELGGESQPWSAAVNRVHVPGFNGPAVVEAIRDCRPDVLVLLGCPIIRPPVLSIPRIGVLNCHTSLLPHFRGAGAEHWVLLEGAHECAGVTVHWATERLDAGDIAMQRGVRVDPSDDPFRLRCRCMKVAVDLFIETLDALERGEMPATPQPFNTPARRCAELTPELRWACCRRQKPQAISMQQNRQSEAEAVSPV